MPNCSTVARIQRKLNFLHMEFEWCSFIFLLCLLLVKHTGLEMNSLQVKWSINCPIVMKTENVWQVYKTVPHKIQWKIVISSAAVTCGQMEGLITVNKAANGVLHDVVHRIPFKISKTLSQHTCKCNFIQTRKKNIALSVQFHKTLKCIKPLLPDLLHWISTKWDNRSGKFFYALK